MLINVSNAMSALETGLALIASGLWPVVVSAPDDPTTLSPGKKPIEKEWGKKRHTPESLREIFAAHPTANIGVRLGPAGGIIDIDVDDPIMAAPALERMFAGEGPQTCGWPSARGPHHVFLWDDRLARYRKAIIKNHPDYPGMEIRLGWSEEDKQYQTVIPPSVGGDGKKREWDNCREIAPLPECFFADLDRHLAGSAPATIRFPSQKRLVSTWDVESRAVAYLQKCEPAVSGQKGHDKAIKAACKIGPGFDLAPDVTLRLLQEVYNPTCDPPWSEKELRHKVEDAYKIEKRRGWLLNASRRDGPPPPSSGGGGEEKPLPAEADDDPHRLARLFVEEHATFDGVPTLRYWLEEWHRWDGTHYQVISPSELRSELTDFIKEEFDRIAARGQSIAQPVTTGLLGNVVQAISGLVLVPARVCPGQPAWLGYEGEDPPDPHEVLAAHNGLVHLPALVEGREYMIAPTPLFFSPNTLGYDFEEDAPRPVEWFRFLDTLWPEDQDSIEALQEWFGYLLTADTSQQKILMVVGPKRSGKGTIARILAAVVGPRNVSSPTLSGLSTNFGIAPLIGKTVAIFPDARLGGRVDSQVIVERLLSISGEDAQTIDRKHLASWNGNLSTRFILVSNELPRLGDSSGALPSRMVVLHLTRSFYGEEDIELTRKLLAELPSILLWSIAGWARLKRRGRFLQPPSGLELVAELEDLSSPVSRFVEERCEVDVTAETPVKEVFEAWKSWCQENGRDHPGDASGFGRNLRAAIPRIRTCQHREEGKRTRSFMGIRVSPGPLF